MDNKFTLLVFLKDRSDFTERFVHYLSKTKYSHHVYFADGSIENDSEKFFGSLDKVDFQYTYKRYPKDETLADYYKKCSQAIQDIKTPYVMLADNDDFPIEEGQNKAIQFLDDNVDYIGCNGRVSGVVLSPSSHKPYGENSLFLPYYCQTMDVQKIVNQDSALDRISSYNENFYSIFYSVFKTSTLQNTFAKIEELNFSELGIVELFFSYLQLAQGKIKSIPYLIYVRQRGSSQAAVSQKDWFYRVFYTNWLQDAKNAIQHVATVIATSENLKTEDVYKALYLKFVNRMRERFIPNQFYILKNYHYILNFIFIQEYVLNKLFRIAPKIAQRITKTDETNTVLEGTLKK